MTTYYARANFKLPVDVSGEQIVAWQDLLHDSAIWAGAEDLDVFFIEKQLIIGISIPVEDDPMLLLEAGSILGQVQRSVEASDLKSPQQWLSIVDEQGNIIDSPF
jgi:hypothetical protein